MKKLVSVFVGMMLLILSFNSKAQTPPAKDYFVGKWSVSVSGTPGGDGKMSVFIERKDGKLTGTIIPKPGGDTAKITKVEEKDKSVTLYFTTDGYDVSLLMEKKDDDHTTGSMMDMFDAKGERVKETSTK